MLLFFSGGLDSTTLGYDVLQCPERYGISLEGQPVMSLLTAVFSPEERTQKRRNLKELTGLMAGNNRRVKVEHHFVLIPKYMVSYNRPLSVIEGSADPHTAARRHTSSVSVMRQAMGSPYTPGLHMFMASVAVNILHRTYEGVIPHHNRPQAFWGFKFEGPEWEAMDRGEGSPSDTTPEFVNSMTVAAETFGHPATPVFRAPFLENRMDRYQVVALAHKLGVPTELTSSCINGWMAQCGHCRQCMVRNQALAAYNAAH